MIRTLTLLLPALIPSWRFFKTVAPSPRLYFKLAMPGASGIDAQVGTGVEPGRESGGAWRPVRPPVARMPPLAMLGRLFWNPDWNEGLYLVTLSERLAEDPTPFCIAELNQRIARITQAPKGAVLEFKLLFVTREAAQIVEYELYHSAPFEVPG